MGLHYPGERKRERDGGRDRRIVRANQAAVGEACSSVTADNRPQMFLLPLLSVIDIS